MNFCYSGMLFEDYVLALLSTPHVRNWGSVDACPSEFRDKQIDGKFLAKFLSICLAQYQSITYLGIYVAVKARGKTR